MKAYKFKIKKPSKRIVQAFEQTLDLCRELYNAALQERRDAYKVQHKSIGLIEQCKELTEIRGFRPDVAGLHSQVAQDVLKRIDKAFKAFFLRVKKNEKAGYPRFKGKHRYNSFTYPQSGFRLDGDKLTLSRIGSMRLRLSREVEGKIKTCTIKRQVDGWFVIFAVEESYLPYIPKRGDSVGIDVGIENFATLSTGEVIENPKYLRQAEGELKIAQRKVSKKKLRGSNRHQAARILARKHQRVANQRRDFFHKLSNQLIREFDEIAVEDLNIKGMVKNHHLAKSISDAAWNTFLQILIAKAENAGRRVWKVAAAFTSQDCSRCGERVKKSLAIREHRCIGCGLVLHRDHNAAINILARTAPFARVKAASPDDQKIRFL
ncbi:MAG TPA: transposase [Blastocatellia bacterium]|nr:transposase [Blastocatellia bacterium]